MKFKYIKLRNLSGCTYSDLQEYLNKYCFTLGMDVWDINTLWGIYDSSGKIMGLLSFNIDKAKNNTYYLYINGIEIASLYTKLGVATSVLNYLFTQSVDGKHKITNIYGESRPDAIDFWQRVGANFDMSDKKINMYKDEGYSAAFCLSSKRFYRYMIDKTTY